MLCEAQVLEIYTLKLCFLAQRGSPNPRAAWKLSMRGKCVPVSKVYGVSPRAIRDIWNRHTWGHATNKLWAQEQDGLKAICVHGSALLNGEEPSRHPAQPRGAETKMPCAQGCSITFHIHESEACRGDFDYETAATSDPEIREHESNAHPMDLMPQSTSFGSRRGSLEEMSASSDSSQAVEWHFDMDTPWSESSIAADPFFYDWPHW